MGQLAPKRMVVALSFPTSRLRLMARWWCAFPQIIRLRNLRKFPMRCLYMHLTRLLGQFASTLPLLVFLVLRRRLFTLRKLMLLFPIRLMSRNASWHEKTTAHLKTLLEPLAEGYSEGNSCSTLDS